MKPDHRFARDPGFDTAALAARLPPAPVTRFAPAPTGPLHLGHVVNALYVWGAARRLGGRVLLRIEDHDRERCRPDFEAALLDDLDWLGFAPDVYTTDDFRAGACESRQSDRERVYRDAAAALARHGRLYGCRCSRRDVADESRAAGTGLDELRYAGRCRDAGLRLQNGLGWRLRIDPGVEHFADARLGPQHQEPSSQCGDLLIRDRRGNWTYQFAVAVDDWHQGIDLVVRGEDLLASTGRQILLARLLGRDVPPVYLHHPLLLKAPGQKLSKSDGDTGIRDLRARGWRAQDVVAEATRLLGQATRD